jgi:hypothetical protein
MITMFKCMFGSGTALSLYDNSAHCVLGLDGPDDERARYAMTPDVMRELAAKLVERADAIEGATKSNVQDMHNASGADSGGIAP